MVKNNADGSPSESSSSVTGYDDSKNAASTITPNDIPVLLVEARAGDVIAQTTLGFGYRDGIPPKWRSNAQAVNWFRIPAHQGFAMAENELGKMYY